MDAKTQIRAQGRGLPGQQDIHSRQGRLHRMATQAPVQQGRAMAGPHAPVHWLLQRCRPGKSRLRSPLRHTEPVQLRLPTEQQQKQTDRALLIVILLSGSALALWLLLQ